MKTYYKGSLFLISKIEDKKERIYCRDIKLSFLKIDYNDNRYVEEILNRALSTNSEIVNILKEERIIKIFDKCFLNSPLNAPREMEIIYERIIDKNGIVYAKELHSGYIFPIKNDKFVIRHNQYVLSLASDHDVYLLIKPSFTILSLDRFECMLGNNDIASNNEVIEYQNRFNGFMMKGKKKAFLNRLQELYNENVFNQEIIEDKPKNVVLESQSMETKVMENIEYLLQKLSLKNKELSDRYQNEYDDLLNKASDTLTLKPLSLPTLTILESKIEMALLLDKSNAQSILTYMDNLKEEYLNNFFKNNHQVTSKTFNELEKLISLFLKTKDEYSLLDQRKVIKSISLIYLLEVKENIDDIRIEQLENSYFKEFLKSIVLCINAFMQLGIIAEDLIVSLSSELTCFSVYELIKKMQFKEIDEEKIKKLSL